MKDDTQQVPSSGGTHVSGARTDEVRTDTTPASPRAHSPLFTSLLSAAVLVVCFAVVIRTLTSHMKAESERVLARITQVHKSLLESHTAALQSASDIQRTTIDRARDDLLKCLAKDSGPAGSSANVASRQAAAGQRAVELGAKALEAGNNDEAVLLFINGINHDPSRLELIRALADAARSSTNVDIAERAIGVLELATIQVAPDDMPETLNHIASLRGIFAPSPVQRLRPEEALQQWHEINAQFSPEAIWRDENLVGVGLSEIEFLGQQIDASRIGGQDDRFDTVLNDCLELSARLQSIQTALPLYIHVSNCIAQMSAALNTDAPDPALISSLSASAQALIAQIWGQMPHLPVPMRSAFNELPALIHDVEVVFQQKTSAPILARAIENMRRAVNNKSGSYTERINRISAALESAAADADLITARDLRNEFFKEAKMVRDALLALELDRRSAYQRWALGCLNGFMNDWNRDKFTTNDNAKKFFARHQIATIDETLIIPEVARILARVMVCMTGELDAKSGSTTEYELAAAAKKRLEDF